MSQIWYDQTSTSGYIGKLADGFFPIIEDYFNAGVKTSVFTSFCAVWMRHKVINCNPYARYLDIHDFVAGTGSEYATNDAVIVFIIDIADDDGPNIFECDDAESFAEW